MTALNALSLPRSRCGFGYAFLEVCLLISKPPFLALRHASLNSLPVPSAMISRSSLREDPFFRRTLQEESAFKTHS